MSGQETRLFPGTVRCPRSRKPDFSAVLRKKIYKKFLIGSSDEMTGFCRKQIQNPDHQVT
ncbi:Uncharacterized protein dnm_072210 [Desulfonema magnum]|uniref:Uncharacterized protein n=1 Tax=Desulfonema magnum TaxID=45655 RepID=A0A975BT21_9BACT|nr:Uncharacterized protein dnm_072210 [Desulfonema magnum]